MYAQAEAIRNMTAVQMKKDVLIEDQNMLFLITMPIDNSAGEDTREYLRLRRGKKLKKLRKRLYQEESRELAHEARVFPVADFEASYKDIPLKQRGGTSGKGLSTSDGSPSSTAARTSSAPVVVAAWTGSARVVGRI